MIPLGNNNQTLSTTWTKNSTYPNSTFIPIGQGIQCWLKWGLELN